MRFLFPSKIIKIQTGRTLPKGEGTTLLMVTRDNDERSLIVQESDPKGKLMGETRYAADDPDISVARAIKDYLITHILPGMRK